MKTTDLPLDPIIFEVLDRIGYLNIEFRWSVQERKVYMKGLHRHARKVIRDENNRPTTRSKADAES